MLKAARASLMILLLICSARAGDIQNGSPQPPPPQPAQYMEEEPTAEGNAPTDTSDTLTEAALSVLNSVLALL